MYFTWLLISNLFLLAPIPLVLAKPDRQSVVFAAGLVLTCGVSILYHALGGDVLAIVDSGLASVTSLIVVFYAFQPAYQQYIFPVLAVALFVLTFFRQTAILVLVVGAVLAASFP